MSSWFQRAREFIFGPSGNEDSEEGSIAGQQQKQPQQQPRKAARTGSKQQPATPKGRVVRTVVPPPQPVLIEVEALLSKQAGIQGLEWYTANKKQDKHGDIADEFLEEQANAPIVQKQPSKRAPSQAVRCVEHGNIVLVQAKRK